MAPVVSLWDFHFFLLLTWASYLQDFLTAYSISFPKPVVCHPDAVTDVLQPWGQPVTKGGWANTVAVCVPYYSQDQERKMKPMLCSEPGNMRLTCTICPLLQPWAGAGEAQLSQAVSIYPQRERSPEFLRCPSQIQRHGWPVLILLITWFLKNKEEQLLVVRSSLWLMQSFR